MIKQAMFNRMVSVKKYVLTQLRKWNIDKTIPEEAAIKLVYSYSMKHLTAFEQALLFKSITN